MSEEKHMENIFAKSGFVLGILGSVLAFIPGVNYIAIVLGTLAIIICLIGKKQEDVRKVAYVGMILGAISIIVTYIIINYGMKFSFYSNMLEDNNEYSDSGLFEENDVDSTEEILSNQLDVIIGEYEVEFENIEDNVEYYYDIMSYSSSKLPVTLRNKSNEMKSFNVLIEAVDENGDRITEDTVFIESLRSGQLYKTNAFQYSSGEMLEKLKNATFKVLTVSTY